MENEDDILDDLFEFPIIMADGEIEQKRRHNKERFGNLPNEGDDEIETTIGMASYPFTLFMGVTDRWLPNNESFRKAQEYDFDACYVTFSSVGSFIVPWTKEKFKKSYVEFVKQYNKKQESKKPKEDPNKKEVQQQIPIIFIGREVPKEENDDKQDG